MNNRKTRTEKLIQLTVLVFLVIRLKYFFYGAPEMFREGLSVSGDQLNRSFSFLKKPLRFS